MVPLFQYAPRAYLTLLRRQGSDINLAHGRQDSFSCSCEWPFQAFPRGVLHHRSLKGSIYSFIKVQLFVIALVLYSPSTTFRQGKSGKTASMDPCPCLGVRWSLR